MKPVTLIVLAWNRWTLTRRLLESVVRHTDLGRIRMIVVDNGSSDETATQLANYPWLEVLTQTRNLGFVRGNNVAIRQTDSESDVVLLNNDVEILHDDWLERLQQTAHSDPHIGIVGCRLLYGTGRLLHAGTWIRADNCWGQQIGSGETDLNQYSVTREVEGIVFACAYLRREVMESVGLLSEDYESYFEDTDYCLRAAENGYRTVCCGSVTMRHDEHGSTGGDQEFRRALFERSRVTFRAKWSAKLDSRYSLALTWQSIMRESGGYSVSCREILRALDHEGVRLSYRFAYGPGTPYPFEEARSSGDPLLDLIRARRESSPPEIAVTYAQGDVFHLNPGRFRIGFTMLEVDGLPKEWVSQANRMDEIWTPTEAGRRAMLSSGVTRPIHVIPLGVDVNHFNPLVRGIPNRGGEFVFVTNLEWGERKNVELLLRVFNATFRRRERAVLVCKINNENNAFDVPDLVKALGLDENGGRVYFIHNRDVPHYQLAALYRSADCFVSTSRGEGWGMPLLEAMSCGVPAIATDWGGHTAILDDADSYPLRIKGTIPAVSVCPYYEGFSWADPDGDHLAELLRHVFLNREEARARGLQAAARVRETLTWTGTARAIVERLRAIGA